MATKSVLIVDDEKNIRLTVRAALAALRVDTGEAANGAEALEKLNNESYAAVLLDLKMPGMDGMEVLRRMRDTGCDAPVIIITAYGTVDSAVEAMKLGAVDFIQKPFSPDAIRALTADVIGRETMDENEPASYKSVIESAKKNITLRDFSAARKYLEKAVAIETSRPEAFNLLGAITEILGDIPGAQKLYRAAISLDPLYEPAKKNLSRTVQWHREGDIILESDQSK